MCHLLRGSMVWLMVTSSKKAYALCCMTQVCCGQSPCPCGRPLLTSASTRGTQRQVWLRLCGVSGFWCAQGFVWALQASLLGWGLILNVIMPSYILLGLLLCPLTWGILLLVGHDRWVMVDGQFWQNVLPWRREWQTTSYSCQSKNNRMISVHFQGKPFNITVIQVYAPTTNAKKAEDEWSTSWKVCKTF